MVTALNSSGRVHAVLSCFCSALFFGVALSAAPRTDDADIVAHDEMRRIEMIERVTPASVCVYDDNKRGGGSGALIDPDGYGITNFHVVAKMLGERRGWGGLGDGEFYRMEVLGIDPTGDVAMFRLLDEQRFPSVPLGDSDAVRVGDPVVVLGDPFLLSEDNMPTVTTGIITGVHRYQGGTKGNLIYSDCLQTDAPINPGNSGGPLFNARGEVIGINGRISVGERGRFNVGLGYSISSNQVRRFVPALRAGLLARHGTLDATVIEKDDGTVVFDEIGSNSPVRAAGFRDGDRLVSLNGTAIRSANHYISIMGTFPEDWPLTVVVRHASRRIEKVIRLVPVDPKINFEYVADREANVRQIKRVLRRFDKATRTKQRSNSTATAYSWALTMNGDVQGFVERGVDSTFRVVNQKGEPARLVRIEDGARKTILTFDSLWAERPDGQTLLPQQQMVFTALYYLQSLLLVPVDERDFNPVEHVGADAPISPSRLSAPDASPPVPWEVLAWQTTGGLTIKVSFDGDSGLARRVRAFDPATDQHVSIELLSHRQLGDVVWPSVLEVATADARFTIEVQSVERLP